MVCRLVFLLSALMLLAAPAKAQLTFPDRPPEGVFVVDTANMLDAVEEQVINDMAGRLLAEERIPLIVVTVLALNLHGAEGMGIERYAQALFDHWGIGSPDRNYGMLVLVSSVDRRARIEFGAGFAGRYNAEAEHVMQNIMIPAFKNYDYGGGLVEAASALNLLARGLGLPLPEVPWHFVIPGAIAGFIGLTFIVHNLFASGRSGWAWALLALIGIILWFFLKPGRGGRGGSFGGGFSGGGGASGGW